MLKYPIRGADDVKDRCRRDGAARLGHDFNVWSITTAAERWKIEKDMDTIYE